MTHINRVCKRDRWPKILIFKTTSTAQLIQLLTMYYPGPISGLKEITVYLLQPLIEVLLLLLLLQARVGKMAGSRPCSDWITELDGRCVSWPVPMTGVVGDIAAMVEDVSRTRRRPGSRWSSELSVVWGVQGWLSPKPFAGSTSLMALEQGYPVEGGEGSMETGVAGVDLGWGTVFGGSPSNPPSVGLPGLKMVTSWPCFALEVKEA